MSGARPTDETCFQSPYLSTDPGNWLTMFEIYCSPGSLCMDCPILEDSSSSKTHDCMRNVQFMATYLATDICLW